MAEGSGAVQEVPSEKQSKEQKVTPWEAHAAEGETAIDYSKLSRKTDER